MDASIESDDGRQEEEAEQERQLAEELRLAEEALAAEQDSNELLYAAIACIVGLDGEAKLEIAKALLLLRKPKPSGGRISTAGQKTVQVALGETTVFTVTVTCIRVLQAAH